MTRADYTALDGTRYIYAGRMRRVPEGGPFCTRETTMLNVALAHHTLGTRKDAWHPDIVFYEADGLIDFFMPCQRLDVWIAAEAGERRGERDDG